MKQRKNNKVLVILGPTASGKTALAVRLAAKFNGEIISADSRQVYRGMDVGTGKDLGEYVVSGKKIPYHLIDVVEPNDVFNLALYQKLAVAAIEDILARGRLPIVVGGTGLYLQAIVDGYQLVDRAPVSKQRLELEKLTVDELYARLEKLKPEFARELNNSERHNPRHLVRYLEILAAGPKTRATKKPLPYNFLLLGLQPDDDTMRTRIMKRIVDRLDNEDMVGEVERLNAAGVSWSRLYSFGLEYRYIAWYFQDKLDYDEMIERLGLATYRFAKRQKTWFRRWEKQGQTIYWLDDPSAAATQVSTWLA
jgi:tRNA dimethylallyltransferase